MTFLQILGIIFIGLVVFTPLIGTILVICYGESPDMKKSIKKNTIKKERK